MNNQYYQKMQELMKYMIFSTSDNKYATKYDNLESIDLTTGALQDLNNVKDQWWDLLIEYLNNEPNNLGHPFFRKGDFPQYKGVTEKVPSTIEFITSMIDLPASFMDSYLNDIKKELINDNEIVDRKRIKTVADLICDAILTKPMNNDIAALLNIIEINDLQITGTSIIKRGDLNEDGVVDVADLQTMQKIISGWKIKYNPDVADVNGDGSVDVDDLTLMQKLVSGWRVETAPDIVYDSCRDMTTSSSEYFYTFENEVKKNGSNFDNYRFTYLSNFVSRIIDKNYNYTSAAKEALKGGMYEVLFKAYQNNHYNYLNENFQLLYVMLGIDTDDIINIDYTQEIVQTNKEIITNFVELLINYCFPENNKLYYPRTTSDCITMVQNVEDYFIAGKLRPFDPEDENPTYYRDKCRDVNSPLNVADSFFTEFEKAWRNYVSDRHGEINSSTITAKTQYSGLFNLLVEVKELPAYNVGFSKTDINNLKRALAQVYFTYFSKNDNFSWNHSAFDLFYTLLGVTPADITTPSNTNSLSGWNESVDLLIRNILNGFDYSLIKYNNKATVEVKHDVFFKLSDILNGDAGLSFDYDTEWVRSWKNSDEQTYKEVRNNDIEMPAITSKKELQFTKEQSFDDIGIRLLLPQYSRNVEIEDLDRNFWVIGQTLTGLMAFLFGENSPFRTVFEGIIKEIVELWENVLYLWLGFAMTLSNKVSYEKIHEEIVYLPLNEFQNEVKYDNFDLNSYSTASSVETDIWAQSGDTIVDKIKNYLNTPSGEVNIVAWIKPKIDYLISKYADSHLGILPVIRLNNYENNYYEAEFYPGFFTYDRNQDTPTWRFWSFKTPTGEQFVSANLNYEYTNLDNLSAAARQINRKIGLVGKSYLNRKSLYYFKPAEDMVAANAISYNYLTDTDQTYTYEDFFINSHANCLFYGAKKTSVTYYTAIRPIFNKVITQQNSEDFIEPFCVYDTNELRFNKMTLSLCDMSKIACNSELMDSAMIDNSTIAKLTWTYEGQYTEGTTNSDKIKGIIVENDNYNPNLIQLSSETVPADDVAARNNCWWLKPVLTEVTETVTRITPVEVWEQKNGFYMGEILTSFVGFFNIE